MTSLQNNITNDVSDNNLKKVIQKNYKLIMKVLMMIMK